MRHLVKRGGWGRVCVWKGGRVGRGVGEVISFYLRKTLIESEKFILNNELFQRV